VSEIRINGGIFQRAKNNNLAILSEITAIIFARKKSRDIPHQNHNWRGWEDKKE
jgi:hypothetical protein